MKFSLLLTAFFFLLLTGSHGEEKAKAAETAATVKEMTPKEAAALKTFQKKLQEVHVWLMEEIWTEENKQARAHRLPVMLSRKLTELSAEGLPADLGKAFVAYQAASQKEAAHLKDMPVDDLTEVMNWMAEKEVDEAFLTTSSALTEASTQASLAFIEVAMSYGAGKEADLFRSDDE